MVSIVFLVLCCALCLFVGIFIGLYIFFIKTRSWSQVMGELQIYDDREDGPYYFLSSPLGKEEFFATIDKYVLLRVVRNDVSAK